jgi:thiol-disulfide isomerase/thioredoxin
MEKSTQFKWSDMFQDKLGYSLRVILSLLFLISAIAKIAKGWIPEFPFIDFSPHFALTTFENKQLIPMGFSEFWAGYFSRTLIGCELALGLLLLQPHYFKRLVLPMSFLILMIFSLHLTYEIFTTGNTGNCGCFGALLPMSPLQALIKNILAMAVLGYLYKRYSKENDLLNFNWVMNVTLGSILLIYLVGPMTQKTTKVAAPVVEEEIVIDTIVKVKEDTLKPLPEKVVEEPVLEPKKKNSGYAKFYADIDKGKKILCFFAPGCDHCKETAKELTKLKKQVKDFPEVKIIFMDEEAELIPAFFEYAGAKYTHQVLDVASFWQAMGGTKDTPGVIYLWNGNIMKEYDGINEKKFKMNEFKNVVTKPYKP